jgi:hypothetical protein
MGILRRVRSESHQGCRAERMSIVQPTLMMPVIQYVMPSRNKQLKKLLHFYWEVCPKYDDNGKLKQEMILVVCVLPIIPCDNETDTHGSQKRYS